MGVIVFDLASTAIVNAMSPILLQESIDSFQVSPDLQHFYTLTTEGKISILHNTF